MGCPGGQGSSCVPTPILKCFPGKRARNQETSGHWLERMVKVPPTERLASGVPAGGDRLSRAYPSHEPKGSSGEQRDQRESPGEGGCPGREGGCPGREGGRQASLFGWPGHHA